MLFLSCGILLLAMIVACTFVSLCSSSGTASCTSCLVSLAAFQLLSKWNVTMSMCGLQESILLRIGLAVGVAVAAAYTPLLKPLTGVKNMVVAGMQMTVHLAGAFAVGMVRTAASALNPDVLPGRLRLLWKCHLDHLCRKKWQMSL